MGKRLSDIWNLVPLCMMWIIWREYHNHIFEDLEHSGNHLVALFAGTSFDCSRVWGLTSSYSIPFFIDSLFSGT